MDRYSVQLYRCRTGGTVASILMKDSGQNNKIGVTITGIFFAPGVGHIIEALLLPSWDFTV